MRFSFYLTLVFICEYWRMWIMICVRVNLFIPARFADKIGVW